MKTDNALGYCHWCVGISLLKTRGKVSECRTVSGWLSMTLYTGNSMSLKQKRHGLKYFSDLLVPYSKCKTPKTANQNTEHSHLMKAWNKLVEYSSLLGSWCPDSCTSRWGLGKTCNNGFSNNPQQCGKHVMYVVLMVDGQLRSNIKAIN